MNTIRMNHTYIYLILKIILIKKFHIGNLIKKISYWKFDKENLQNYAIYDNKNYREEILFTVL